MFELSFKGRSQSTAAVLREMICAVPTVPVHASAPTSQAPALLTAREAAKLLAVCEKTLWALTKSGEIPVVRIGRSVRYDPRDLSRWIDKVKSMPAEMSAVV